MALEFNYVVTIHNQEKLLPAVLAGVLNCAGREARLILVLDGCSDSSEKIAEEFAATCGRDCRILRAPDVHEIKSINLALAQAKPGYCVILQDDVVLQEPGLEALVDALCERHHRALGYISFRLAADVRPGGFAEWLRVVVATRSGHGFPMVQDFNHAGGISEVLPCARVDYATFAQRMVGIKSPVCLTPELRRVEPYLDERLAPYCYDDVDLSLRALKRGLRNGVFPIHFQSKLDWGGTRRDSSFAGRRGQFIRARNRRIIWQKHGAFIRGLAGP